MSVLRSLLRHLPLCLLLAALAQATSLTATQHLLIPGPASVNAVAGYADGSRFLCLGSRWVWLDGAGNLRQVGTLSAGDLCQGLSLSPDGKTLLVTGRTLSLWKLRGAGLLQAPSPPFQTLPDVQGGFLSNTELLLRLGDKLSRLNIISGKRESLTSPAVSSLLVSPDGQRAIISDWQKVQFLRLPELSSLSGYLCEGDCTVKNATFTADGHAAVIQVRRQLVGLREGWPASTVLRNVQDAVGFAQPNNTVLTVSEAGVEIHDFQTGRREKRVAAGVVPPAALLPGGRVLALSDKGELLDADLTFTDVKRQPLPGSVQAGGLEANGGIYALSAGALSLNGRVIPGAYWAVETMNKTTWAVRSDADGGTQLGLLNGENFTPMPGSPRTATHLSVNFWGNHAAVWDNETLWIASQSKNKVIATIKLDGKADWVTVSPDGTRAFVYPGTVQEGVPDVITLSTGKRAPGPEAYHPAGGWVNDVQLNGHGFGLFIDSRENLKIVDPRKREVFNGAREAAGTLARFSPDGKWLAYFTPTPEKASLLLTLVNLETGHNEATSPPLASLPTFLTWSADSKKVAVGASLQSELSSVTVFELR